MNVPYREAEKVRNLRVAADAAVREMRAKAVALNDARLLVWADLVVDLRQQLPTDEQVIHAGDW